jgi:hypothetical protein
MAQNIKSKFKDINRTSLKVRGSVRLIIRISALFISLLNLICTVFLKLALLQSSGKSRRHIATSYLLILNLKFASPCIIIHFK